jgi:hypothetical protein
MKIWELRETATAPVLVAGRIVDIQRVERVPDASLPWKAETWAMSAEVEVLRSFGAGAPAAGARIGLSFLRYGPGVRQFVEGYPPPLPDLAIHDVCILPLERSGRPDSDFRNGGVSWQIGHRPGRWRVTEPWKLIGDSGSDLTIPARAEMIDFGPPPSTRRAFLDREIANSLSGGTTREIWRVAQYLSMQEWNEELTPEILPLLRSAIGNDRQRWAEVAANLTAAEGIPRTIEPRSLRQAALQMLRGYPYTTALLVESWISEAPLHAWGSAMSLVGYGDDPIVDDALRRALQDDVDGSCYIAWTLARNGHRATLPDALDRALRVVNRPNSDRTDLQGAAALIRDFGSDAQLAQLAAVVRKYQAADRELYGLLWQYATQAANPREAPVLAVVLRDRRIAFKDTRYCDLAAGELERAVHQDFGSRGKTIEGRDAGVARALAWIASHPL